MERRRVKECSLSLSLSLRQVAPVYVARAPGAPLTESEREEGPVSQRYTGGVKRSPLSTPEIFRFFQRRRFDLACDRQGKTERVGGGRKQQKQEEEQHT